MTYIVIDLSKIKSFRQILWLFQLYISLIVWMETSHEASQHLEFIDSFEFQHYLSIVRDVLVEGYALHGAFVPFPPQSLQLIN